jgi:hypothetical protein
MCYNYNPYAQYYLCFLTSFADSRCTSLHLISRDIILEAQSNDKMECHHGSCQLSTPHIHSHKVILSVSCEYLRALFQSGMHERYAFCFLASEAGCRTHYLCCLSIRTRRECLKQPIRAMCAALRRLSEFRSDGKH